jgi:hypothetical protein
VHLIRTDVETVLSDLASASGIHRGELSRRFHRIKSRGDTPRPGDANKIDETGDVYDGKDQYIRNVFNDL